MLLPVGSAPNNRPTCPYCCVLVSPGRSRLLNVPAKHTFLPSRCYPDNVRYQGTYERQRARTNNPYGRRAGPLGTLRCQITARWGRRNLHHSDEPRIRQSNLVLPAPPCPSCSTSGRHEGGKGRCHQVVLGMWRQEDPRLRFPPHSPNVGKARLCGETPLSVFSLNVQSESFPSGPVPSLMAPT